MIYFSKKRNPIFWLSSFLYNHKFTVLFFLFLLYIAFKANDFTFSGSIALNIITLLFTLNLIARIPNKIIRNIINILFIFIIFISAFFSITYSDWIWTEAMLAILRTDFAEANEMTKAFIMPGLISLGLTISLTLLSEKELRRNKVAHIVISLAIVLLYSFAFVPYKVNKIIKRIEFITLFDSSIMTAKYTNLIAPIGYGSCISIYSAFKELSHIKEMIKNNANKKNPEGIVFPDSTKVNQIERIIFVLGESSCKNHYSLYGYNVETTPFLDNLKTVENSPLSYYNAISPAPATVVSIHRTMAFSTISDVSAVYTTKSIVDIANDCGYQTYWISNQNPIGDDDNAIGSIALGSKKQEYLMSKNTMDKKPDINLMPLFEKAYNRNEKQFIVLHLMGSHIYYASRIDSLDQQAINPNIPINRTRLTVEDYDRSIHQTDRVMRSIYNIIKEDKNTIMIYIPDHGEIVGLGHFYMQQFKDQYEIPFIVYNFTDFPIDQTVSKYKNNEEEFNTMNIHYVISEMLGCKVSDEKIELAKQESPFVYMPNGMIARYNDIKSK